MANFDIAYQKLIVNEGGYANNLNDKGGETYKGIARNFWPNWVGWSLIDENKNKSNFPLILEVDEVLQEKVKHFYWVNFWDIINGDNIINQDVAFSIFDFAVNAGVEPTIKMVQEIIKVNADGLFGKNTLASLNLYNNELFLAKFALAKIAKYVRIVKNNPTQSKFFFGWICRVINQ